MILHKCLKAIKRLHNKTLWMHSPFKFSIFCIYVFTGDEIFNVKVALKFSYYNHCCSLDIWLSLIVGFCM